MPSSPHESIHDKLNLELENKLVNPSLELYESLKLFSADLYHVTRETLIETHNKVSEMGIQFYNHPAETTTEWYGQAANLGSESLETINNKLIPELIAIYDTGTRELQVIGVEWSNSYKGIINQTIEFCETLYNNPTETLNLLYSQLQKGMENLTDYTMDLYNQAVTVITLTYQSSIATLNLFYNEPKATAQAFYYDVLSSLLDLYAQLINFTLQLLGSSIQVML